MAVGAIILGLFLVYLVSILIILSLGAWLVSLVLGIFGVVVQFRDVFLALLAAWLVIKLLKRFT